MFFLVLGFVEIFEGVCDFVVRVGVGGVFMGDWVSGSLFFFLGFGFLMGCCVIEVDEVFGVKFFVVFWC